MSGELTIVFSLSMVAMFRNCRYVVERHDVLYLSIVYIHDVVRQET
jgi:hypothetical protein